MAVNLDALDSTASESFTIDTDSSQLDLASNAPEENLDMVDDLEAPPSSGHSFFDDDEGQERSNDLEADQEQDTEILDSSEEKPGNRMSIDVNGKTKDFNLDPEDETTRRTLRKGVKYDKLRGSLDKYKSEATTFKEELEAAKPTLEVFQQIQEHISDGNLEYVAQAVLGDNYESFVESIVEEAFKYSEATPEERLLMDRDRETKSLSQKERAKEKQIKELQSKLDNQQFDIQAEKMQGYATDALRSSQFSADEVVDSSKRHSLNKKIWRNSWDTISELSEKGRDISPKLVKKVFERESKLLKEIVGDKLSSPKAAEEKKKVAKQTAAATATQNYPSTQKKESKFNLGNIKSAHDLMKFLK